MDQLEQNESKVIIFKNKHKIKKKYENIKQCGDTLSELKTVWELWKREKNKWNIEYRKNQMYLNLWTIWHFKQKQKGMTIKRKMAQQLNSRMLQTYCSITKIGNYVLFFS